MNVLWRFATMSICKHDPIAKSWSFIFTIVLIWNVESIWKTSVIKFTYWNCDYVIYFWFNFRGLTAFYRLKKIYIIHCQSYRNNIIHCLTSVRRINETKNLMIWYIFNYSAFDNNIFAVCCQKRKIYEKQYNYNV